eukprot:CAMPEP_0202501330 /NCGR_PEP_ID=MMETSP1361-20130828/35831_1 /ASSEMBLY_ACC=CAM_ASM_000849 /TAXON_ID=210615 /ORGANISM="Staurosira complex sp., Strain CCMP2646" /LENGTH=72 /DNA_ID=CAMNT_0049134041 /DNA_START=143 /DNA_END=358 /DNA_ORIENTATION=-
MDQELSEQISKHALTTAQIENEMTNVEGNTTQERTAADVKNINAKQMPRRAKLTATLKTSERLIRPRRMQKL